MCFPAPPGIGRNSSAGQAGTTVGYSDSPTITYVPASDAAFYKSLYSLFQIEEGIGFGLGYRFARMGPGWQALSLRFMFGAINEATDAAGATGFTTGESLTGQRSKPVPPCNS